MKKVWLQDKAFFTAWQLTHDSNNKQPTVRSRPNLFKKTMAGLWKVLATLEARHHLRPFRFYFVKPYFARVSKVRQGEKSKSSFFNLDFLEVSAVSYLGSWHYYFTDFQDWAEKVGSEIGLSFLRRSGTLLSFHLMVEPFKSRLVLGCNKTLFAKLMKIWRQQQQKKRPKSKIL